MKLGVFFPDRNREHQIVLQAFYRGMQRIENVKIEAQLLDNYKPIYDVAVVFGVYKKDVPISYSRGRIIKCQLEAGKNVVVLEKGYINRDQYYAVGLNGLNGRANFNNQNSGNARFSQLNIQLKPWRNDGDHVIVAGQVPSDASVQNVDILLWAEETVKKLKQYTNRNIVYRPHPLAISRSRAIPGTVFSMRKLEEDLHNAWAVVTYNSNTAVDAAIAGIPVFVGDLGSMALPIANQDLKTIENPIMPNRDKWLYNLAYAQWNLEEMMHGIAWTHIKEAL